VGLVGSFPIISDIQLATRHSRVQRLSHSGRLGRIPLEPEQATTSLMLPRALPGQSLQPLRGCCGRNGRPESTEARSTVMLTVLHGIQAEMEYTWSANDMYRHISSRHKVDTTSRATQHLVADRSDEDKATLPPIRGAKVYRRNAVVAARYNLIESAWKDDHGLVRTDDRLANSYNAFDTYLWVHDAIGVS